MAGEAQQRGRYVPAGAPRAVSTWHDRLLALRDRLLMDPRFQRAAAAFPPTRPIARARARKMFDLCAGFVYSQVLFACVRLRLLETLRDGPADPATLAGAMRLPPEAADRLLQAAATLGLVDHRSGGRFGLGPHGAALLATPAVRAMIEHHAAFYADMADPVALLRGEAGETQLMRYWPYSRQSAAPGISEVSTYTELMAASQDLVAAEILDAYNFGKHTRLLDVGGGNGTFLRAVAEREPRLGLMLFDLPAVALLAESNLANAGLAQRVEVLGGDFRADPIPEGADVVSLVRVIHDHDDALVRQLLRKIHAALPSGGGIVVAEPLAETPGAEVVGHVYFGFYLMAMGSGRARTFTEIAGLLEEAGFSGARKIGTRLPLQVSVIAAKRT
jgi:demethylspheroidene O-methyltransferase